MPNGSCSPPGPRSPTACSSPANGTSGRSSPGTRPTTTDGAPTAAGSSARPARPALTIPLADLSGERIKRRRVLGGLTNEYERVALEDQVNAGGQVLEPHRSPSASARVASTSRTDRPRMKEAITRDSSALVLVTCAPNNREANASVVPRSLGRASLTGPAVVLTATSR